MAEKSVTKKADSTFRLFFIDDDGGNKLQMKQNDKLIILTLLLNGDKPRRIGRVTKSTRTIEMKRKSSIHIFRKMSKRGGYGFCHFVLNNQTTVDWVRLSDDLGRDWKIPVKDILEKGSFLHFKKQNFEKQIFLSLEQLDEYIVPLESNRRF